jgi:hypothetical protein
MAARNAYVDWLMEWLAPLGTIVARPMMGGHIVYADCVVFALVAENTRRSNPFPINPVCLIFRRPRNSLRMRQ